MAMTADLELDDASARESGPGRLRTVITPPTGRALIDLGELWRFRDLLYFLAWRDVKVRYKQTALGVAWAVLQPAMMMVVFTLFFRRMAGVGSGDVPYPLFAYAGLLPWTFFSTAVGAASNSVIGSERIITKIYFPRLAIPFATVGASVIDFAIAFGLLAAMMAYYGVAPAATAWLAPAIFVVMTFAALGVGTLLSALNVSYRDFRYVVPFLLQVWMFATPTIYMQVDPAAPAPTQAAASAIPGGPAAAEQGGDGGVLRAALVLNPMTSLVGAFRAAVLGGPIPWGGLAASTAASFGLFAAGCLYFRRVEDRFADII